MCLSTPVYRPMFVCVHVCVSIYRHLRGCGVSGKEQKEQMTRCAVSKGAGVDGTGSDRSGAPLGERVVKKQQGQAP